MSDACSRSHLPRIAGGDPVIRAGNGTDRSDRATQQCAVEFRRSSSQPPHRWCASAGSAVRAPAPTTLRRMPRPTGSSVRFSAASPLRYSRKTTTTMTTSTVRIIPPASTHGADTDAVPGWESIPTRNLADRIQDLPVGSVMVSEEPPLLLLRVEHDGDGGWVAATHPTPRVPESIIRAAVDAAAGAPAFAAVHGDGYVDGFDLPDTSTDGLFWWARSLPQAWQRQGITVLLGEVAFSGTLTIHSRPGTVAAMHRSSAGWLCVTATDLVGRDDEILRLVHTGQ